MIESFEELQNVIDMDSSVSVLLIDPHDITNLKGSWLGEVYERGIVIAALDTPMTTLAAIVGQEPKVDDLRPKHKTSNIGVAAIHKTTFGQHGVAKRQHSELYPNFGFILVVLESFLNIDSYERPSQPLQASSSGSDYASWTDSWGTLYGLSYETKDNSTYYGHGYSEYRSITPYWLYVATTTSNNCDYWHQIDHQELYDNYVQWLSIDGLLIGDYYACDYTRHTGLIESTHKVKAYSYSNITTGNTEKEVDIIP